MNAKEIVLEAGTILKKRYYEKQNYSVKERFHLLSQVDIEMDKFISKRLTESFPTYSVYSEESETIVNGEDAKWILDPIDGTTNFIMGNPYFAISLALVRDGEIAEGHVYNPVSDEYFFAAIDTDQAYLNDEQIDTAQSVQLDEALVAFGYSGKMFDNEFREYDYRSKGAIFCSEAIEGALRNAFSGLKREKK